MTRACFFLADCLRRIGAVNLALELARIGWRLSPEASERRAWIRGRA